jgi:hypothetical protein
MRIAENKDAGKTSYDVTFEELRLEEITARLNRFKRADEKPFAAVNAISEFNQRAYELFGRPVVKAVTNEYGAKLSRLFHPLRAQRWAFSDLNPALSWLAPVANAVKEHRQTASPDHPARNGELLVSEMTSASLDLQRALRDALSEATFFEIYGNLAAFYLPDQQDAEGKALPSDPRELSFVKEAIEGIDKGGYPEALARVGFLMAHKDVPLPLSRLQLAHDLLAEYREFLPNLPMDQARRIGGEQEIIARYEPDKAVTTLPALLRDPNDRKRLLTFLDRVLADKRVQRIQPTAKQTATLAHIRQVLTPVTGAQRSTRRGTGSVKEKARPRGARSASAARTGH